LCFFMHATPAPSHDSLSLHDALPICLHVIARHRDRGEPLLEHCTDVSTIERVDPTNGLERFVLGVDDESRLPVIDDLRNRAAIPGDHRCSARKRLDHHETEWLWPVHGKYERASVAEKRSLLGVADLADELHERIR